MSANMLLLWFGCSFLSAIYILNKDYKDQGYITVEDCLTSLILIFGSTVLIGIIAITIENINFDFLDYMLFEKKDDL